MGSGYNEGLHLQCLESVLDWRIDKVCVTPDDLGNFQFRPCSIHTTEHAGFIEHLDEIYQHRLSIEYKYQVASCLDNQPEVRKEGRKFNVRSTLLWIIMFLQLTDAARKIIFSRG